MRRLKSEPSDKGIYLAGGGKLAGTLLPEIDELLVKSYPVVAGVASPRLMVGSTPRSSLSPSGSPSATGPR